MLRKTSVGCLRASLFGVAAFAAVIVSCRPMQVDPFPAGTSDPDKRDEPLPKPPRDSTFYRFCLSQFDLDSDGVLSDGETAGVTVLDLQANGLCYEVRNLDGIERFINLEVLRVSCDARITDSYGEMLPPEKWDYHPGQLQEVDLSFNHRLTELYCKGHEIAELTFARDASLEVVECSYNCITSIDVAGKTSLKILQIESNRLEDLDLSGCDALVSVNACDNRLSSVNAAGLPVLNEAFFSSNVISDFSLGSCPELQNLQIADNKLLSIELSFFPKLSRLYVAGNKLASLESAMNPELSTVSCERNRLQSLELSNNLKLKNLRCYENLLPVLDISRLEQLTSLDCSPMDDDHSQNTLKKLMIFKGQSIRYVTYERNEKYIPEGTEIVSIRS